MSPYGIFNRMCNEIFLAIHAIHFEDADITVF